MAVEFARFKSNGLSCIWHIAGMLSEIHIKADQHCSAEDCFVDNME